MAISSKKKALIDKAKELGINVPEHADSLAIQRLIDEATAPPPASKQPSRTRGEY